MFTYYKAEKTRSEQILQGQRQATSQNKRKKFIEEREQLAVNYRKRVGHFV